MLNESICLWTNPNILVLKLILKKFEKVVLKVLSYGIEKHLTLFWSKNHGDSEIQRTNSIKSKTKGSFSHNSLKSEKLFQNKRYGSNSQWGIYNYRIGGYLFTARKLTILQKCRCSSFYFNQTRVFIFEEWPKIWQ